MSAKLPKPEEKEKVFDLMEKFSLLNKEQTNLQGIKASPHDSFLPFFLFLFIHYFISFCFLRKTLIVDCERSEMVLMQTWKDSSVEGNTDKTDLSDVILIFLKFLSIADRLK